MKKKIIREKKHRLWPELYTGERVISYTGNVKKRKQLFKNMFVFKEIERILLAELKDKECDAFVYLFMPYHFHFILCGKHSKANIKKCIDSFKQKSGFWLYKNMPDIKWQKDYYDHILRNNEDLTAQIWYILNNPVRAGIVEHWKDYKLRGSTIYNLDEWEM